jgi:phosphoglycolate phosphatase
VGVGNTVDGIRLKPGARAALDWCRARYVLALATNRSSAVARLLGHLAIAGYWDVIVSGETAPHFKPHPWGVHHVRDRLGLSAEELVFVGDSPHDIEFAVNGGIRSIGIGDNWRRGPHAPTWTLDDISDLPALLATL